MIIFKEMYNNDRIHLKYMSVAAQTTCHGITSVKLKVESRETLDV